MINQGKTKYRRSPWLEIFVLAGIIILSYVSLTFISFGAGEAPVGGLTTGHITLLMFGIFFLAFSVSIIAVLTGIGGGVIYTPIMLAFTPIDSLIIRATSLLVAMFSGMVSSGLFLKTGVANLKIAIISTLGYGLGGFSGAQLAIYVAQNMGEASEGLIRIILGIIVALLGIYFIFGGKKSEWPVINTVGPLAKKLRMTQAYYEPSTDAVVEYKITRARWGILAMFGIGLLSGFFGLGAGWAIVPGLNIIMGVPLKVAAATSGVIIGMGDSITVWPYILVGAVIPLFAAPWIAGQVLGGIIGSHLLVQVRAASMRYMLIGIMFFTSFGLLGNALTKLGIINEVPGIVYIVLLAVILTLTVLAICHKLPRLGHKGNHHEK